MARITISEAARQGYAARPTIYRHIKSGKLSVTEEGDQKLIDVAELVRVYGEPGGSKADAGTGGGNVQVAVLESERDRLKGELERMQARLREAEDEVKAEREKAEKERDRFLGIVENAQRQIEDMRAKDAPEERLERGLWSRLFGRETE